MCRVGRSIVRDGVPEEHLPSGAPSVWFGCEVFDGNVNGYGYDDLVFMPGHLSTEEVGGACAPFVGEMGRPQIHALQGHSRNGSTSSAGRF